MLPLIYTKIVYALIFWVTFLAWIILELSGPVRWRSAGEAKKQDRGSLTIALSSGLLGVLLCFLLPVFLPGARIVTVIWDQSLLFFLGFFLMIFGIGWRWYAIRTLGRYFLGIVAVRPDQQIVQHGPYRLIRHPSYSGALLAIMGVGLVIANWVSLFLIVTCLIVGLMYRISVEERALCQTLGRPYEEYMRRTKRLIPFVF